MTNLQKLIDFLTQHDYHAKFAIAKSTKTCVMCGQPADKFSTKRTALEYHVSSLCEACQDTYISNAFKPFISH